MWPNSRDYQVIGSIGFAQVGRDDYHEKMRIEMEVMAKIVARDNPLPDELIPDARIQVKSFPHDFGTYHELCVTYPDEWNDDDENPQAVKFWEWFNEAESIDYESEESLDYINKRWSEYKEASRDKGEHLSVAHFQKVKPFQLHKVS